LAAFAANDEARKFSKLDVKNSANVVQNAQNESEIVLSVCAMCNFDL